MRRPTCHEPASKPQNGRGNIVRFGASSGQDFARKKLVRKFLPGGTFEHETRGSRDSAWTRGLNEPDKIIPPATAYEPTHEPSTEPDIILMMFIAQNRKPEYVPDLIARIYHEPRFPVTPAAGWGSRHGPDTGSGGAINRCRRRESRRSIPLRR